MSEKARQAKELHEARVFSYAEMRSMLGDICDRHLRRLLAEAGIADRKPGRPPSQPQGRRISLAATGLI